MSLMGCSRTIFPFMKKKEKHRKSVKRDARILSMNVSE